jgi:hypothetical protein
MIHSLQGNIDASLKTIRLIHDCYQEAVDAMDLCISSAARGFALNLALVGDPGLGKTTLAGDFMNRYEGRAIQLHGRHARGPNQGLVLSMPAGPSLDLVQELILGSLNDRAPRLGFKRSPWADRVASVVFSLGTPFIFLDECHHLFLDNEFKLLREAYQVRNWLKLLAEALPCPLVLAGLPQTLNLLRGDWQLSDRFQFRVELAPLSPTWSRLPVVQTSASEPDSAAGQRALTSYEDFCISYQDEVVGLFDLKGIPNLRDPELMRRHFYVTRGIPRRIKTFYLFVLLHLPENRRSTRIVTLDDFSRAAAEPYFADTFGVTNGFTAPYDAILESISRRSNE